MSFLSLFRFVALISPKQIKSRLIFPFAEKCLPDQDVITKIKGTDFLIKCNPKSFIENQILLTGIFEETESDFISRSLMPGMTAIDVGANVGVHTLRMAACVGRTGRVWAFEPNPEVYDRLNSNIQLNALNNINTVPAGVSDSSNEIILNVNKNWNKNATMVADPSSVGGIISFKVPLILLDDYWCNVQSRAKVDFIKIDVEGFELHVLRSATSLIKVCRPIIIFEYSPRFLMLLNESWDDYFNFFDGVDYSMYDFNGNKITSNPSDEIFLNIIARSN